MTKKKCIECGKVLVANQYGVLYCPKCQKGFNKDFNEIEEESYMYIPEKKEIGDLDYLRFEYIELYEEYKKLKVSRDHNPKNEFLLGLWHDLVNKLQVNILKRGYIEHLIEEGMICSL